MVTHHVPFRFGFHSRQQARRNPESPRPVNSPCFRAILVKTATWADNPRCPVKPLRRCSLVRRIASQTASRSNQVQFFCDSFRSGFLCHAGIIRTSIARCQVIFSLSVQVIETAMNSRNLNSYWRSGPGRFGTALDIAFTDSGSQIAPVQGIRFFAIRFTRSDPLEEGAAMPQQGFVPAPASQGNCVGVFILFRHTPTLSDTSG